MSVDSVTQVEKELGYTPQDADVLKGVRLIWQRIQKLRGQAIKDEKYLGQFRDTLKKALVQAKAQQAPEDDAVLTDKTKAFWDWYKEQSAGFEQMERNRGGLPHQDWCAKWLPKEWNAFYLAYDKVVEQPSDLHLERCREKAKAMLEAYKGAFKSG